MPSTTYPSALPIQVLPAVDFTGGLNLRADAFQLGPSESPDMMNVDVILRGGFGLRDGVAAMNSTVLTSVPKNIWSYANGAGTNQVLVQQGNDLAYSTGTNFTAINPDALTTSGTMRATNIKDACYIQRNAEQVVVKWNGTASSVLGTTFNENIAAPTAGNMPKAKCITSHLGYVFVANTVEAGTAYKSRIRWSHPNQPEDFRTNDYIDIDIGHDGDEITALVPFADRLLVFKNNSVHVLYGYDASSWAVQSVSQQVGTISQESVCASEAGVYFFSWPDGLMLYGGGGVERVFQNLDPLIHDGSINASAFTAITVGWINRRVWVSVPYATSTTNSRVFVLDPMLATRIRGSRTRWTPGGWMQYDLPIGPMLAWQPPAVTTTWLACHPTTGRVLKLHQNTATDDFGAGAVDIVSSYTTRWFDAQNPAVQKRWKRPEIVLRGTSSAARIRVDVWHDFDVSEIKRTLFIDQTARAAAFEWGDNWGSENWSGDSADSEDIVRMSALGRSRAVRLKFTGPSVPSLDWTIDAVTFKFIPRRIRA